MYKIYLFFALTFYFQISHAYVSFKADYSSTPSSMSVNLNTNNELDINLDMEVGDYSQCSCGCTSCQVSFGYSVKYYLENSGNSIELGVEDESCGTSIPNTNQCSKNQTFIIPQCQSIASGTYQLKAEIQAGYYQSLCPFLYCGTPPDMYFGGNNLSFYNPTVSCSTSSYTDCSFSTTGIIEVADVTITAASTPPSSISDLEIECPPIIVEGKPATFNSTVSNPSGLDINYEWSIDGGINWISTGTTNSFTQTFSSNNVNVSARASTVCGDLIDSNSLNCFFLSCDDLCEDADWYKENSFDTPESITNNIYTMGQVSIGANTPNTNSVLDVKGNTYIHDGNLFLTSPTTSNNSGSRLILAEGNGNGERHSIGVSDFWTEFKSATNRGWKFLAKDAFGTTHTPMIIKAPLLGNTSAQVGINQTQPIADLEVGGEGIMVIDAYSNGDCPTRRSGLYFRRDFSPYGWANNPGQLKNMSIRPRGLCNLEDESYQDGLEINGHNGITLTTGKQDRFAITRSGSVKIGFKMPDCQNPIESLGCNGFLLEVNGSAAKLGGGSWIALSDKRLKEKVNAFEDGLEVLQQIEPVFYHYNKASGLDTEKEYIGVIAQDLKKAAPYMVEGGYKTAENGEEYYTVDPSAFDYILINSVKAQQAMIETQAKVIEKQQALLEDLTKRLEIIEAVSNTSSSISTSNTRNVEEAILEGVVLRQNTPNPFSQTTSIEYQLPSLIENTSLKIYDLGGILVKNYPLNTKEGVIEVDAGSLPSGTYVYAIEIGNKRLVSRKMLVQH